MVGKTVYSSVPAAGDLENNGHQKKYTVNHKPDGLVISKALCTLMAIGAILLAVLVGLIVFFLVPRCSSASNNSDTPTLPQLIHRHNDARNTHHQSNAPPNNLKILHDDHDDDVDERLPRSIEPNHYRLQIIPYFNNLTTNGGVTISLTVKEDTNEIVFHVKDIEIDKSTVRVSLIGTNNLLKIKQQQYEDGEKYRIILDEKLKKNNIYNLELLFTGHLNKHLQGFYRSEYNDPYENTTKYLVSTQFSPTDARRAYPCFDEPSFKANFSINIARPSNLTSISNMPIEKSYLDVDRKDWTWDSYKTTPKMSTYLTAFIVSDLQAYGAADKLIKIWSRKNLIYQTPYAADLAPKILHYFEDYFTIKFPLAKIDIVAIPDFGYSAMENWGLITFRESALLYDQDNSNIHNQRDIATILAHELGHQWFGNLVTPKWWKDLWLKEGFATYLQYLGVDHIEPTWKIHEEFIISETMRAFSIDAYASSRSISFDVKNNKQIRQTFDELSYAKGACIIRMMNHYLGEDTFKHGLINYLQKYQYSNADRKDLFDALTVEAHNNDELDRNTTIEEIMNTWTEQAGFPVITAIADHANKKLILSQKRFSFTNDDNDNNNNNATWWVPVSLITFENPDFDNTKPTVWLKNAPMLTVDLNTTGWYLLNVNQTGYFIVNYDEANWRLLINNIIDLPPLTRAQLISDAMDLARANLLDYDIPLRMIARMAVQDTLIMYVPTNVAFNKLQYLNDMLSTSPIFGLFEEYHSIIFRQTYRMVDNDNDYYSKDYLKQQIRRVVLQWACKKSDSECAIKAHHKFRTWMEKNTPVPPNLRDIVYCTAVREGTEAEWNFAYEAYLRTNSVSEKNTLLDALGCTTKKWLLSRYLDLLLQNNSSIKIQDADRVFKSVADNNIANTLAFDFLRTNWNELLKHYGEGFNIISKMVKSLPKYMNTEYQLSELMRFRDEIKDNLGTASQAFDVAIEKVKSNVEWMKKNYHSIERWLIDHKYNYNLL